MCSVKVTFTREAHNTGTPVRPKNTSFKKSILSYDKMDFFVVGARGFEPPASWSRTKRSTKLSHAPKNMTARSSAQSLIIYQSSRYVNSKFNFLSVFFSSALFCLILQGKILGGCLCNGIDAGENVKRDNDIVCGKEHVRIYH